ncbi:hypothetical protein U1Q18_038053 [Sarracenia purpurea var. burkii]
MTTRSKSLRWKKGLSYSMVRSPSLGIKPLLGALAGLEDGGTLTYGDKVQEVSKARASPSPFDEDASVQEGGTVMGAPVGSSENASAFALPPTMITYKSPTKPTEILVNELESIDAQVVEDTSDEAEGEVEISDIRVRTAEHDIGMAVQKFKNMKDAQDAPIRARKGKESQPVEEIRGTVPIKNPNQFDCFKGISDAMEDFQLPSARSTGVDGLVRDSPPPTASNIESALTDEEELTEDIDLAKSVCSQTEELDETSMEACPKTNQQTNKKKSNNKKKKRRSFS